MAEQKSMKQGKIIKGISGFYYVHTAGSDVYECRAKGIFRKEGIKPLVGDNVSFDVTDEKDKEGNITGICPRKNELIRPAVANVDQAVVIFAVKDPKPNLNLLDRFLITMEKQQVPSVICFSKCDLVREEELDSLRDIYSASGYPLLFLSSVSHRGIDQIRGLLENRISVVAGPSGVGKSTLINQMSSDVKMETGAISRKNRRGRNTTRHAQLISIGTDSYIVDTPGFTALSVDHFEKEEVGELFPEFIPYEKYCKFAGCSHISEPQCGVRDALDKGLISPSRYESYREIYEELLQKRKY